MSCHCSSYITLYHIALEWAGASSPLSQLFDATHHHPHSALLHLQVAMATGCLASQSTSARARRQAILTGWLWSTEQIALLNLSRICFFPPSFFLGGGSNWQFGYTQKKKKKMSSKSEIFDKCPAWFITMSVWSTACFVPSLLSLLLFSVHGAQSLRWAISALLNVIFVISVSFWTKFCCTSIYNSSKENHLVLLTQHLLPSCEAHSHRGVL